MNSIRRRRLALASDEAGLTLMEIMVAITLIAIVATASASLSLTGLASAASQSRRQVAVTIASGTLENVSAQSIDKNSTTGVSNLYTGRSKTAIDAAWLAAAGIAGVSETYEAWDPTATGSSVPTVAITAPTTQSNTAFTVVTLIGKCYQLIDQPAAGSNCGRVLPTYTSTATAPTTVPSTYFQMIRVIVNVRWTVGKDCSAGCSYTATTLIDPNDDLDWVTHE